MSCLILAGFILVSVVAGEDPRLHGLYHNCGYNAAGTMLGGGCGDQLAQWIVHGRPDLHMFDYDIRWYRQWEHY